MVYDPSATPVRELILQDIVTTIAGITVADDYANDIGPDRVARTSGNVLQAKVFPFVAVVEQFHENSDHLSERVETVMRVALCVAVRGKDWRSDIQTVLADLRVALLSTPQRGTGPSGGNAIWTQVVTETVYDAPAQIGTAQLDIEVLFRTAYLDPTTPLN